MKLIHVLDAVGNVVIALSTTEYIVELNVEKLASGMYLIQMFGNENISTCNFIKQ